MNENLNQKKDITFSIDANIINRLGKELVARQETAVSELVKNAYDADATKVELIFIDADKQNGTLKIIDNGLGMNEKQLINGFMRISSSDKLHYPNSLRYNRKRAGKKGIGRFSTQRLGTKLTVITQTKDSEFAYKVSIDWDMFSADIELGSISNKIEIIGKNQEEGTILIIENLRDIWKLNQIKKVYKYASEVIQPFPLSKVHKKLKIAIDPGFKLICKEEIDGKKSSIANENKMFFEHSLAEIDGYIDSEGYMYISINSPKLDYKINKKLLNEDNRYKFLKNIYLKAYYFIYAIGMIPKQTETYIKEKAKSDGGIRLYRDGFRVVPYGEPQDDWLGLDASVRRRTILPTHSNINFFGFIELNDQPTYLYEETSSREGLMKNDAFEELTDFGYALLVDAVLKIANIRGVKQKPGQEEWKVESVEKTIDRVIDEVKTLSINNENDNNIAISVINKLEETKKVSKEKTVKLVEENNLLRVLATLGLTIGEFIHEINHYKSGLSSDIDNLIKYIDIDNPFYKSLKDNLEGFNSFISYFDESISQNAQRELKSVDLKKVVKNFAKTMQNDFVRKKIEFVEPIYQKHNLYTIPMHKSEWTSILLNLYTNSLKAIKRAKSKGKIYIEAGRIHKVVYLEFSDNGDGIKLEDRQKIFQPFFTTSIAKGKVSNQNDELTGTGLGLKILKDMINSYGGKIMVIEPKDGYSTTIRVELPWDKEGYRNE